MPDSIIEQLRRNSEYRTRAMLAPSPPKLSLRESIHGLLRVAFYIGVIGGLMWFGWKAGGILFFLPPVICLWTWEYLDISTTAWSATRRWISALGLFVLLSSVVWLEFVLTPLIIESMREQGSVIVFASRLGLALGFIAAMIPLWLVNYLYERITKPRWSSHPVYRWRIYEGIDDPKNRPLHSCSPSPDPRGSAKS
jgi:hypothetical protein